LEEAGRLGNRSRSPCASSPAPVAS
jgi:hypothetical protein